jgi:hypothetical protein
MCVSQSFLFILVQHSVLLKNGWPIFSHACSYLQVMYSDLAVSLVVL